MIALEVDMAFSSTDSLPAQCALQRFQSGHPTLIGESLIRLPTRRGAVAYTHFGARLAPPMFWLIPRQVTSRLIGLSESLIICRAN